MPSQNEFDEFGVRKLNKTNQHSHIGGSKINDDYLCNKCTIEITQRENWAENRHVDYCAICDKELCYLESSLKYGLFGTPMEHTKYSGMSYMDQITLCGKCFKSK